MRWLYIAGAALSLAACAAQGPRVSSPSAGAPGSATQPGAPAPPTGSAAVPAQPPPAPQTARLDAVTAALVKEAHGQALAGAYAAAGATLERALRIEPADPLLWVELGRVRLAGGSADQAEGFGRKALTLAGANASAQGEAWRLIADSLRVRGRVAEAADAERHVMGATPH